MVNDWKIYKLSEITDLIIDCPHSTPKWTDNGIFVLRSNNIRNGKLNLDKRSFTDETHYFQRIKRAIPQSGDLVLTREAPMGEVCMVPDGLKCCLGQRMVLIRPSNKVNNTFLLYVIQGKYVQNQIMIYEGTGSTVSNLRIPILESLNIPFPPFREQCSIATILSALDDKIELNLQMNKTLEEMAMCLYKHWFVDFGPFQEGEFVESELGMIPKGWEAKRLDAVLEIKYGKDHKKLKNGTIPVYGSGGIMRYVNQFLYDQDSILIPRKGTLSNLFYLSTPFWSVDTMFYSKIKEKHFGKYIFHFLKTIDLASMDVGSAVPSLTTELLNKIDILVPPTNEVIKYDETVTRYFNVIEANTIENKTLTTLRETLLPKLISGEVRVKEAEKILEEVF